MEKNNPVTEQIEQADIVAKARANKQTIAGVSIAVLVVIVGLLIWFFVAQSGSRKADEAIGRADMEMNDSIAQQLYAAAATSGYRSGNRAKAEMGIRLYNEGKYQEAAEYLSDCSLDDNIANAGVASLEGDCYVNLDQLDKAVSAYKEAISRADSNPQLVPFFLAKLANVYRAQENYAKEAEAYKEILDDYPNYSAGQLDIRALYERANAAARN
ncbi:MAG: hypothetical protein K2L16_04820 [Muribaculaceae bacterium]|nr:hypothetical protein [Muribaculaceae bacterium]